MRLKILLLACVLMCILGSANATTLTSLLQAVGLTVGDPETVATDFELPNTQGKIVRLHELRGQVVFVNFWATWCLPCIHEMPMMEQLYQAFKQQPMTIVAVNMQQGREEVRRFMESKQFHFPALLDHEGTVTARYQVRGLPTTHLIDCAGNDIGRTIGVLQWTHAAMPTLVSTLLKDAACTQPTTTMR
jgi:peroxiredoxin